MDHQIEQRLKRWHDQIEVLTKIEGDLLNLEASEDSFFSDLVIRSTASSIAMKEHEANASSEWRQFSAGLAACRTKYNYEKRMLDLKIKAYESTYLHYKLEHDAARRA